MFDPAFKERLDTLNESLNWSDVINTSQESGTITCPFCNKRGKGYLYPNFFKCFSSHCGVQGDKINIYKQGNNLSFGEALSQLESKSCLDFQSQQDEFEKRNELLDLVLYAYTDQLNNHPEVVDYLYSRGFEETFIKQRRIGYTAHSSVLRGYDDLKVNTLRRHNLVNKRGDFFYERIIFPVYNTNGYLVHMTGRSFPRENKDFKYLDTPQVPIIGSCKDYLLFEDMLSLYRNKDKTLFLVEGVPDSYILNQCGASVVGLMGLQKILKQASKFDGFDTIIAVFDNDRYEYDHPNYPGEYKSWRVVTNQLIDLQLYLGNKIQIKTSMIPESIIHKDKQVKDINDLYLYLNRDCKEVKRFLKEQSKDLVETFIENYKGNLSYHRTALKLVSSTGRGKEIISKYIPADLTTLDYALEVLSK
jgi:hypothetical protein